MSSPSEKLGAVGVSEPPGGRVRVLAVLQSLQTAAFMIGALYLYFQMMTPEVLFESDPSVLVHRLRAEAAKALAIAIPALFSATGLWRGRRWAYWLCILVTSSAMVTLASGLFEGVSTGGNVFWILLPLLAQFIFSLLPGTRFQMLALSSKMTKPR